MSIKNKFFLKLFDKSNEGGNKHTGLTAATDFVIYTQI